MTQGEHQREYVRLDVTLPVRFTLLVDQPAPPELADFDPDVPLLGRTRDLSAGGCLLESETALPPGTMLDMILFFPNDRELGMIGQVVREVHSIRMAKSRDHWLAVQWVGGSKERDFITNFIFREQAARRQRGLG